MNSGAIADINLSALEHNCNRAKQLVPTAKILAMIKGNAYGHGLIPAANTLTDADAFGVACLSEGIELRQAGIDKRIVIMRGFFDIEELELAVEHDFDVVIHCEDQLQILTENTLSKPIEVWLKIDTGMHRLGFSAEQVLDTYTGLQQNPNVKQPVHVITHLANADIMNDKTTKTQLKTFAEASTELSDSTSIANSAAIFNWPETHTDWIRPGIMLYGVSPLPGVSGVELNLQPVMTLRSKLIALKNLKKGDSIGYGSTWTCPKDMVAGVVAIGYGDGYPRHAKNGTPVLVNGIECQLVGRVSMDMLTVDLRNNPQAKYGDTVTLWGQGLPVEIVAEYAGTIPYELLSKITSRVRKQLC